MSTFIRERVVYCGDKYKEVDIIPYTTEQEYAVRGIRRQRLTSPKQKNLNDRRAKRYFCQLVNTNFGENDYRFDVTYTETPTEEQAAKNVRNFLSRLKRIYDKKGLPFKWIYVTEGGAPSRRTGKPTRLHHHFILSGGISRDDIEMVWNKKERKKSRLSCQWLQPDDEGLTALAKYLVKEPQGKSRWHPSRNLKKPVEQINDHRYTTRSVVKLLVAYQIEQWKEAIEKLYQGWRAVACDVDTKNFAGAGIYIKLIRKEDSGNGKIKQRR